MATTDPTTVLPGGAALAGSAGDVEGGAVEARGYWENAFRRLPPRPARDRERRRHRPLHPRPVHRPRRSREGGSGTARTTSSPDGVINFVPVGPFSTVSDGHGGTDAISCSGRPTWSGATSSCGCCAGAQVSLEVGILSTLVGLGLGRRAGADRRLLRRSRGHHRVAPDRDRDGLPAPALPDRHLGDGRRRLDNITLGGLLNPGCSRSRW